MRSILKKLRSSRAGFSLAETLMAILILLMVSAIVGGAIPAASNAYTKTVDVANAELLLSTAMNMLRSELGTAQEIDEELSVGNTIVYKYIYNYTSIDAETHKPKSVDNYRWSKIVFGNYNIGFGAVEGIWVFDSNSLNSETAKPEFASSPSRLLVSKEAITKNLKLKCEGISYDSRTGVITFTNLSVWRDENILDFRSSVEVRTLIKNKTGTSTESGETEGTDETGE
jgi:hypothetical protein